MCVHFWDRTPVEFSLLIEVQLYLSPRNTPISSHLIPCPIGIGYGARSLHLFVSTQNTICSVLVQSVATDWDFFSSLSTKIAQFVFVSNLRSAVKSRNLHLLIFQFFIKIGISQNIFLQGCWWEGFFSWLDRKQLIKGENGALIAKVGIIYGLVFLLLRNGLQFERICFLVFLLRPGFSGLFWIYAHTGIP